MRPWTLSPSPQPPSGGTATRCLLSSCWLVLRHSSSFLKHSRCLMLLLAWCKVAISGSATFCVCKRSVVSSVIRGLQDGAAVIADEVRLERATACDGHKPAVAAISLPRQRRLLTRW
jgi:hypothetical protein